MSTSFGRSPHNQQGIAIAELALLLPLLLLLGIGALELVRTSAMVKVAAQLSRDAANTAFRDCGSPAENRERLVACLTSTQADLESRARRRISGDIRILFSAYATDASTPPAITRLAIAGETPSAPTRYDISGANFGRPLTSLPNQSILVAEVYVPANTLVRSLLTFWHYDPGMLYDATLL